MLNKATLMGRLGQNAEAKFTPNGTAMTTFSMATSEKWKDKGSGQKQERTTWHKVILWGRMAETLGPMLDKGKLVYVEGRIEHRSFEGKDGTTKWTTQIVANQVILVGGKSEMRGDAPGAETPQDGNPEAWARDPEVDHGQDDDPRWPN